MDHQRTERDADAFDDDMVAYMLCWRDSPIGRNDTIFPNFVFVFADMKQLRRCTTFVGFGQLFLDASNEFGKYVFVFLV